MKPHKLRGAALAYHVLHLIRQNPQHWNQEVWHCGSAHCFAGYCECVVGGHDIESEDNEWYYKSRRTTVEIALDALGLTAYQGRDLFDSDTSFELLESLVFDYFGPEPV